MELELDLDWNEAPEECAPALQTLERVERMEPPPRRNLVRTPVPWRASDPPLVMGSKGAWFGRDSVHPSQLVNIQILGGTGSGKTASCVEPPLAALLNYAVDGLQTAMLVIDPKRELEAKVRQVLTQRGELDRLVVVGECAPMRFFAVDSPLSATERLAKCKAFGPLITPTGDGSFWHHLGMALLRDLLHLQTEVAAKTEGGRLFELMAAQLGVQRAGANSWGQIREILSWIRRGGMAKLKEASEVLEHLTSLAGVDCAAGNALKNYTKDDELFRQFTYACQSADPLVNALSNPDISHFVDLDALPDSRRAGTDIGALVEAGRVILFCPEAREDHRLAGKALKAKFFEAVFARENLERPVAYVCDEAQRFVTQDPESGEQNFLDRCRAYRAICVLASQSLSSMEHELGSDNAACTALDIISSNTPTKFILRTTDTRTIDWLRSILPGPDTQGPHVVDVRRPAQLRVGEAYSVFADGHWGLHRARLADLA
ncbi:TraM recognition domain-containing protein [Rhodoferax lacus]|nr:type IV secretory system conjugative DNA transfer family protein [Rhodoferax lacus]